MLVNVDLTHKDNQTGERFESEVAALDEVIELRRMFGLPDYVVCVGTPDLDTFEAFVPAGLGAVPGHREGGLPPDHESREVAGSASPTKQVRTSSLSRTVSTSRTTCWTTWGSGHADASPRARVHPGDRDRGVTLATGEPSRFRRVVEPLRHELRAAARAAHGTAGEPRRVTVTSIFVSNEQREHTAQREALRATSEEEARPVLRRLEERLAAVEARLDRRPSSGGSAP